MANCSVARIILWGIFIFVLQSCQTITLAAEPEQSNPQLRYGEACHPGNSSCPAILSCTNPESGNEPYRCKCKLIQKSCPQDMIKISIKASSYFFGITIDTSSSFIQYKKLMVVFLYDNTSREKSISDNSTSVDHNISGMIPGALYALQFYLFDVMRQERFYVSRTAATLPAVPTKVTPCFRRQTLELSWLQEGLVHNATCYLFDSSNKSFSASANSSTCRWSRLIPFKQYTRALIRVENSVGNYSEASIDFNHSYIPVPEIDSRSVNFTIEESEPAAWFVVEFSGGNESRCIVFLAPTCNKSSESFPKNCTYKKVPRETTIQNASPDMSSTSPVTTNAQRHFTISMTTAPPTDSTCEQQTITEVTSTSAPVTLTAGSKLSAWDSEPSHSLPAKLRLTFDQLQPSTKYAFNFKPQFCYDASTSSEKGSITSVTTLTAIESVNILNVNATGKNIYVKWKSSLTNVTYVVWITDIVNVTSDTKSCLLAENKRTTMLCSTISENCSGEAPVAFWEYNVTVEANTSNSQIVSSEPVSVITEEMVPPKMTSLKLSSKKESYQCGEHLLTNRSVLCVTWRDPECPRDRNGIISHYNISLMEKESLAKVKCEENTKSSGLWNTTTTYHDYRRQGNMKQYALLCNVQPGKTYEVTLTVVSRTGNSENTRHVYEVPPVPRLPEPDQEETEANIPKEKIASSEKTLQFFLLSNKFLLEDSENVPLVHGTIVTKGNSQPVIMNASSDYDSYPTWANRSDALNHGGYRIKDMVLDSDTNQTDVLVTIGDEDCSNGSMNKYCDGPLDAGQSYSIWVFVCNEASCVSVSLVENQRTKEKEENDIKWGEVLLGAGLLIASLTSILAISCFFRRKRGHQSKGELEVEGLSNWETEMKMLKKANFSRPMKLFSLANVIAKKSRHDGLLLRDEFEDIRVVTTKEFYPSYKVSLLEFNRGKNRYADILPFDDTRVKLSPDSDGSDYINASFVPGYSRKDEYVAAQGPLPFTTGDFWRMIWEYRMPIIVMLTQPKENGKIKCEHYWPPQRDEVVQYESILVTNMSVSNINDYNITIFSIRNLEDDKEESHDVIHFHYLKWTDMTADVSLDSLLEFVTIMRQHVRPDKPGPIVVHCSAGVGRTGTFICIDFLMQFINERMMTDELDIYGFVLLMRKHRCKMIQTEDQYLLVHECASYLMNKRRKQEAERGNRLTHVSNAFSISSLDFKSESQESLYNEEDSILTLKLRGNFPEELSSSAEIL